MDNKENNSPLSGERAEGRYSVCLVFTKLLGDGKVDIMMRNQINYAVSNDEALGKAIKYFESESKEYSLTCKSVVEINQSRIAELEAENATMREALEDIKLYASHDDNDQYGIYEEKAEQALKGKEVKGE